MSEMKCAGWEIQESLLDVGLKYLGSHLDLGFPSLLPTKALGFALPMQKAHVAAVCLEGKSMALSGVNQGQRRAVQGSKSSIFHHDQASKQSAGISPRIIFHLYSGLPLSSQHPSVRLTRSFSLLRISMP